MNMANDLSVRIQRLRCQVILLLWVIEGAELHVIDVDSDIEGLTNLQRRAVLGGNQECADHTVEARDVTLNGRRARSRFVLGTIAKRFSVAERTVVFLAIGTQGWVDGAVLANILWSRACVSDFVHSACVFIFLLRGGGGISQHGCCQQHCQSFKRNMHGVESKMGE